MHFVLSDASQTQTQYLASNLIPHLCLFPAQHLKDEQRREKIAFLYITLHHLLRAVPLPEKGVSVGQLRPRPTLHPTSGSLICPTAPHRAPASLAHHRPNWVVSNNCTPLGGF